VSEEPSLPGYERTERRTFDAWAADVHRRT
jgi:hypothetical protein